MTMSDVNEDGKSVSRNEYEWSCSRMSDETMNDAKATNKHGFNRGKPRKKGTILIEENRERKRKGKRINF